MVFYFTSTGNAPPSLLLTRPAPAFVPRPPMPSLSASTSVSLPWSSPSSRGPLGRSRSSHACPCSSLLHAASPVPCPSACSLSHSLARSPNCARAHASDVAADAHLHGPRQIRECVGPAHLSKPVAHTNERAGVARHIDEDLIKFGWDRDLWYAPAPGRTLPHPAPRRLTPTRALPHVPEQVPCGQAVVGARLPAAAAGDGMGRPARGPADRLRAAGQGEQH